MKIEEGKFYRTRDGRKVGPMTVSDIPGWPWEVNGGKYDRAIGTRWAWRKSGTFGEDGTPSPHDLDLIAEWTDGPVRTVTRREVVAGSYGIVDVISTDYTQIELLVDEGWYTSDQLKAAAAVLLELAGALEE